MTLAEKDRKSEVVSPKVIIPREFTSLLGEWLVLVTDKPLKAIESTSIAVIDPVKRAAILNKHKEISDFLRKFRYSKRVGIENNKGGPNFVFSDQPQETTPPSSGTNHRTAILTSPASNLVGKALLHHFGSPLSVIKGEAFISRLLHPAETSMIDRSVDKIHAILAAFPYADKVEISQNGNGIQIRRTLKLPQAT